MLELKAAPGHLIRRTQQVHTNLWAQELQGDLTGPQYAVLAALSLRPGASQKETGELASLDKSSVADVLVRLASRGWLSRDVDPTDGRRRVLQLTPAARRALTDVTAAARRVQGMLLEPLPPRDREPFRIALRQVAYKARPPVPGPGASDSETEPVLQLDLAIGHLVRRAEQVHGVLWGQELHGQLTPSQYAVLSAIWTAPGSDQNTIGELASLDKSSVADVLDRLGKRGWIERFTDANDGRRVVWSLAAGFDEELAGITPRVLTVQRRLLDPLSRQEQPRFLRRLQQVAYQHRG